MVFIRSFEIKNYRDTIEYLVEVLKLKISNDVVNIKKKS
jgi:hypothetical protein